MNLKRLICALVLGMIFGLIYVIGTPITTQGSALTPNFEIFLIGAWYNRVIMGLMVGLAEDIKIYKDKNNIINTIIRGAIIGALVSASFAFLRSHVGILFFLVGIVFGVLNDAISTRFTKYGSQKKELN